MVKGEAFAYAESEYAGIKTLEHTRSDQSNNTPEGITLEGSGYMVLPMINRGGGYTRYGVRGESGNYTSFKCHDPSISQVIRQSRGQ